MGFQANFLNLKYLKGETSIIKIQTEEMETQLLRDEQIFPAREELKKALGDSYTVYEELMRIMSDDSLGLVPQWNYYKDGKAWLCKVCYKKKTVFWLSVWDGFFRTGFYFTEKTSTGVTDLDIEKSLKEDFIQRKPVGKLLPLAINVRRREQLEDLVKIIEYKKSLK